MKELYEKIMANEELQKKIMEILTGAEEKGVDAAKEELVAFAKEQGHDVTFDEIRAFLQDMQKDGDLSDAELDMVAGGKSDSATMAIISVGGFGLACLMMLPHM